MYVEEADTHPIEIRIHEAVERGTGLSKYTVYTIKGSDKLGEFEVQRRFNEFHALRELLI